MIIKKTFHTLLDCDLGNITRRYEAANEIYETFDFLWRLTITKKTKFVQRFLDLLKNIVMMFAQILLTNTFKKYPRRQY